MQPTNRKSALLPSMNGRAGPLSHSPSKRASRKPAFRASRAPNRRVGLWATPPRQIGREDLLFESDPPEADHHSSQTSDALRERHGLTAYDDEFILGHGIDDLTRVCATHEGQRSTQRLRGVTKCCQQPASRLTDRPRVRRRDPATCRRIRASATTPCTRPQQRARVAPGCGSTVLRTQVEYRLRERRGRGTIH